MRPDEVTFTASGTDAVHRGLLGPRGAATATGRARRRRALGGRCTPPRWARRRRRSSCRSTGSGRVDLDAVGVGAASVVAVQSANHEVGTLQPVARRSPLGDVPLFVDACASMGRLPLPDGWYALAGSAHKWGGPAGVGVLRGPQGRALGATRSPATTG